MSIEPYGQYVYLLPGFQELVDEICENDVLGDVLEPYTKQFTNDVMVTVIHDLMNLKGVDGQEGEEVVKCLIGLLGSLAKGVVRGSKLCENMMTQICDTKAVFYTNGGVYTQMHGWTYPYKKKVLTNGFAKGGPAQTLVKGIVETGSLEMLKCFLELAKECGVLFDIEAKEAILCLLEKGLMRVIDEHVTDHLRESDVHLLTDVTKFVSDGLSKESSLEFVQYLLAFSDKCLKCDFMDKQIIGCKLMYAIIHERPSDFGKWAKEIGLVDFLLNHSLHETVMSELYHVFYSYFDGDHPSKETLMQLYNKKEHAHSSQKHAMDLIVKSAIRTADESDMTEFLQEVIEKSEVTPDLIVFMKDILIYRKQEVSGVAMGFLLKLVDEGVYIKELKKNMHDSRYSWSDIAKEMVYSYIMSHIDDLNELGERLSCFKEMVHAIITYDDKREKPALMSRLEEALMAKPEHAITYASLIAKILIYSKKFISGFVLGYLMKTPEGWKLLAKILKQRGLGFIDDSLKTTYLATIEQCNYAEATEYTWAVIQETTLSLATEDRNIENTYYTNTLNQYTKVYNPMIRGLTAIFQVQNMAKNDSISALALAFILQLFKNAHSNYMYTFSSSFMIPMLEKQLKAGRSEQVYRSLELANAFIRMHDGTLDVADFGIKKHVPCGETDITFYVEHQGKKTEITCSRDMICSDLYELVAFKLGKSKSGLYLKFCGEYLTQNASLCACGVTNGSVLVLDGYQLKDSERRFCCLTEIFAKKEIIEDVYSIIQREDASKELMRLAWEFLMLMPTAESVMNRSPVEFAEELRSAKTGMHMRYLLQSATKQPDVDVIKCVFELIIEEKVDHFALYDALSLVQTRIDSSSEIDILKFCIRLLEILGDDSYGRKFKVISVDMLTVLTTQVPQTVAESFMSDTERLRNILTRLPASYFTFFSRMFERFGESKSKLFSILISFIDTMRASKTKIAEYFKLVLSLFDETCDVESSLDFGISMFVYEDTPLFEGVCQFVTTILEKHPEKALLYMDIFDHALEWIFISSKQNIQESLIKIAQIFAKMDEKCLTKMKEQFAKQLVIVTDRWNYNTSHSTKSSTGFAGLRNLGSTCYMNSIFQNLFHNIAFRKTILESKSDNQQFIEFRRVMAQLYLTALPFVDTEPFAKTCKFNGNFNPREQQDASEFFQYTMDILKDEQYKGELSSIMSGVCQEDGFRQESTELFWNIPLDVKGCKSFDASLDAFLQKETVSGYKAEQLGKVIDIEKFCRIKKAPNFLVIQLKRFEYNYTTWRRYKVNDKFVFPMQFDLGRLMEGDQHEEYQLTGLVMHNGTAEGGHYTSYVKIGKRWFLFNDTTVDETSEAVVLKEAYGGGYNARSEYGEHSPSAYMLFYAKKDLVTDGAEDQFDMEYMERVCPELVEEMKDKNKEYLRMQALFSPAMLSYILQTDDIEQLVSYFFNVFCHSSHSSKAKELEKHMLEVLSKEDALAYFAKVCVERIEDVRDTLIYSSVSDVMTRFVLYVFENAATEIVLELMNGLMKEAPSMLTSWIVVPRIYKILTAFCYKNIEYVRENGIVSQLILMMKNALQSASTSWHQNANFGSLFSFLKSNMDLVVPEDVDVVSSLISILIQGSQHSDEFVEFIQCLTDKKFMEMDKFVDICLSGSKDTLTMSNALLLIGLVKTPAIAKKVFDSPRISKDGLVKLIEKGIKNDTSDSAILQMKLLQNPKFLFYLITCNSLAAVERTEALYIKIFSDAVTLDPYPGSESLLDSVSQDFLWNDKYSHYGPTGERAILFERARSAVLEGLTEMHADPEAYLSGASTNRRLCCFYRILLWMLVRLPVELTEENVSVILDQWEDLGKMNIMNNVAFIDFARILMVLPTAYVRPRLHRIIDIALSAEFSETCIGDVALITNLMAYLESSFGSDAEAGLMLYEHPNFSRIIRKGDHYREMITTFSKFMTTYKYDIAPFISDSFTSLLECYPFVLIEGIQSSGYEMTNEQYTQVIERFVRGMVTVDSSYRANFTKSTEYLDTIFDKHEIIDAGPICEHIPGVLKICATKSWLCDEGICTIMGMICRNPDIRAVVTVAMDDIKKSPDRTLLLETIDYVIRMHDHQDTVENRAELASITTKNIMSVGLGNSEQRKVIMKHMHNLIKADGCGPHRAWALSLLDEMLLLRYLKGDSEDFVFSVVSELSDEDFLQLLLEHTSRDDPEKKQVGSCVVAILKKAKPHMKDSISEICPSHRPHIRHSDRIPVDEIPPIA